MIFAFGLLTLIALQFRWKQRVAEANSQLAALQLATLEAAFETETKLSFETTTALQMSARGAEISARALLFNESTTASKHPRAVVVWNDASYSGQLIFLSDSDETTTFSSMSGQLSIPNRTEVIPISFTATRTPNVVAVQATEATAAPKSISIRVVTRSAQGSALHWVGPFRR